MTKKLVETYTVIADEVPAVVRIFQDSRENVLTYDLEMPEIGPATQALLDVLTEELADTVPLDIATITDLEELSILKKEFLSTAKALLIRHVGNENKDQNILAGILLHRIFGLGFIDVILADNYLEELTINSSKHHIAVYHKRLGWCTTSQQLKDEEQIYNLAAQIGRKVGREINILHPIMDAHLLTGDRVAATMFPISTAGNTLTIRRFARNPWTIIALLSPETKTLNKEIAAFLWLAVQYELNILVAGGTASGKTSMLNSICGFMPPTQRIISIEDTREINLPKELEWNWVPLTSRPKNPEGQGEVTMLDLMVASLRMRPDRIIVGEMRRREQAEALFEAMHTGHSVYATMHADTVHQVKRRLLEPPIQIPKTELEALHLILVQYRDRRRGLRRTLELAEILSGTEKEVQLNILFRWHPRSDTIEKVNQSVRVVEDLNLHTGMTIAEIHEDLKQKEAILQWMFNHHLLDITVFGRIMKYYYVHPNEVINAALTNENPTKFLT
ncbi:type II/IV secretion system ATPase subunit [Candidatus Woesearchaeota archaeon]|nr:type II/IV secretion system ATPase subunit [Candidatus Woesearchaeota archaeon]